MSLVQTSSRIMVGLLFSVALGTASQSAFAKNNTEKNVSATRQQVKAACDKSGGVHENTNGKSGGYGCISDGGSITCTEKGKCKGSTSKLASRRQ